MNGFWKTFNNAAHTTLFTTIDNFAVNTANAASASQTGDSHWAVVAGTLAGFAPALLLGAVGGKLMGTRFRKVLTPATLKRASGALLLALGAFKLYQSLSKQPFAGWFGGASSQAPEPSVGGAH